MPYKKLHADEVNITPDLVTDLIRTQAPHWANLPIRYLESAGTDNVIYRLGDDKLIRLPRIASAEKSLRKEVTWLPKIASQIPFQIPTPLFSGMRNDAYPLQWSVYRWLDGSTILLESLPNTQHLARDLATFIKALQRIKLNGAPPSSRAESLAQRDQPTRKNIELLRDQIDADTAHAVWESALNAPQWQNDPVWIHADLQAGNLLTQNRQLSAVIDFGLMGLGDPACDLQVAWNLLPKEARNVFFDALEVDDAMILRGRGWVLSVGVIALPYYQESNPTLANIARRAINASLHDFRS